MGRSFRTVILTDAGTLESSLKGFRGRIPGAVNLHPVLLKRGGVFHAKLALLRAGRHARACIGSANLTDGGLGGNLELWTWTETPDVVAGLQHFLLELTQAAGVVADDAAIRSVRRAASGLIDHATPSVWSSLEQSFAERLRNGPEAHMARTTIVSPLYAGPKGLEAARGAIPTPEARFYTNQPTALPNGETFVYVPSTSAEERRSDYQALPHTLHAKAYVFHARRRYSALAWVGGCPAHC
jgi:hypothetical protein